MKKLMMWLFTALLAIGVVFAGGQKAGSSAASDGKKTVALILPTIQGEFWAMIDDGLSKNIPAAGYNIVTTSYDGDSAKLISAIENYTIQKVDLIAMCSMDKSADDAVKAAMDKGIKVMAFGNDQTYYDVLIQADNKDVGIKIGEMAANYINTQLGGRAQVGVIGSRANINMAIRTQGILDTLKEKAPGAQVVMEANALQDTIVGFGMEFAENLLQKYPNAQVVCSYGDLYAVEVMEGFKTAGKAGVNTGIFSCDATEQALLSIKNNDILRGTVSMGNIIEEMTTGITGCMDGTKKGIVYGVNTAITSANVDEYLKNK
jgi:ABC-type sugar transport system substrate-binding protein